MTADEMKLCRKVAAQARDPLGLASLRYAPQVQNGAPKTYRLQVVIAALLAVLALLLCGY